MGIVVPFTKNAQQNYSITQCENQTLAEAICNQLGVPPDGKALTLRMQQLPFFSNVEVISIWLATQIDHQTFEDDIAFELVDTLCLLLTRELEKKSH